MLTRYVSADFTVKEETFPLHETSRRVYFEDAPQKMLMKAETPLEILFLIAPDGALAVVGSKAYWASKVRRKTPKRYYYPLHYTSQVFCFKVFQAR